MPRKFATVCASLYSVSPRINSPSPPEKITHPETSPSESIGAAIAMKRNKFPLLRVLDYGAVGLIFGQALGRWGNFMNQEAFGAAITDKAWQWFPNGVFIEKTHKVYDVASKEWVSLMVLLSTP